MLQVILQREHRDADPLLWPMRTWTIYILIHLNDSFNFPARFNWKFASDD